MAWQSGWAAWPGGSRALGELGARFARRWPAQFARALVTGAPLESAAAGPKTVVEIGRQVPKRQWFEIVDIALRSGAWVALPAEGLAHLARRYAVPGPERSVLLLAPRRAARRDVIRRPLDVIVSAGMLLVLSPVLLVLGLAVRLSSPGPALHRDRVTGHGGRPFVWYKFRTMRLAAPGDEEARAREFAAFARGERGEGPDLKVVERRRVTRLGGFLRRHSLDELPQLWNVARGQMALVGPRPALPYEVDHYEDWQRRRLALRPGLTGLWQVYGRSRVAFDDAVVMDVLYGYLRSFTFDLGLLARTVLVVLRGDGGR